MEIDDEDVVIYGTDLQKYLNNVGHSEFEVSYAKNVEKSFSSESYSMKSKSSRKMNQLTQNNKKDFNLCVTLIKIIIESQLMFKEDTLFIKEFIPSDDIKYPLFFTKRNSFTFLILWIICGLLSVFLPEKFNKWTTVSICILWIGYIFMEILYDMNQNRTIINKVLKTIKSMEKLSMLIHKMNNFLHECNNLHNVYNSCNDKYADKNANCFVYLLMPELKILLMTVVQDLINNLVNKISEIHTYFPLKDSVSNVVYLYLADCKIDLKNTSLENINKAKYTYLLLQSEFLKQLTLCLCPVVWTPKSFSKINSLIDTISKIEKDYSNSYNILYEEFNVYSLFKNNNISHNIQPDINTNSDLKLKVYNIRQHLQSIMVNVKYIEDSIDNCSKYSVDDINITLNILLKDINVFNELVSALQIYVLKKNNNQKDHQTLLTNTNCIKVNDHLSTKNNKPIKAICEDELFLGISDKFTDKADSKLCNEMVFDKSNHHNLMLELKVALKVKQDEWKIRENKLLEKYPQLSECELSDEENNIDYEYSNKIRKVACNLPPNENFSVGFPSKSFANEIAMVACKWNSTIDSLGDESDSSINSNS